MIDAIQQWCAGRPEVTAAILMGSRARRGAVLDDLSDWDVVLVLNDPDALQDEQWFAEFGDVLVSLPTVRVELGQVVRSRWVQYTDGSRIDFSLFSADILRVISYLPELPPWIDAGYQVLYDPGNVTGSMVPPFGRGYAGRPPTSEQVQADIEEFWWEALVVSKELLRGEPLAASYCAESVMRHGLLRRMLEWMAGVVTGWSQPGGPYGRGVTQVLPVNLVERAQSRILSWEGEAGWAELDRMATLFAEVARSVCANIGAAYPDEIEHGARAMITERRSAVG
jgi:aminoglycoside 6-adenylyltransferase